MTSLTPASCTLRAACMALPPAHMRGNVHMQTIETDRLLLRPFTGGDLDAIYSVLNRPAVWQYDPGKPRSYDETRDVVQRWIADFEHHGFGRFAVVLRETDTLIGYCGLQWL